jgi:hypothetical protein
MPKPPRDLIRRREAAVRRLASASESLRGSLIERFLPCGKQGCRCKSGDLSALHGPAYYLTLSYPGGRTRQVYVPKRLKPVVERWLANYRQVHGALEEITAINLELVRQKVPSSE